MGLFSDDDMSSLNSDNHKSFGTRIGLKFDPTYYLAKLFGKGNDYANFINKTGDKANQLMSKGAEPMFSLARKYTPGREDGNGLDKVLDFAENKPASITGVLIGGGAAGSALAGGGAGAGGGAAGGSAAGAGGGAAAAPAAGGSTAGGTAAGGSQGFDWQGALKSAGGSLQQQGQQEDEMATKLAMMGPPPNMQGSSIMAGNPAEQYAEMLKRAPTGQTRGEAQTTAGLTF